MNVCARFHGALLSFAHSSGIKCNFKALGRFILCVYVLIVLVRVHVVVEARGR